MGEGKVNIPQGATRSSGGKLIPRYLGRNKRDVPTTLGGGSRNFAKRSSPGNAISEGKEQHYEGEKIDQRLTWEKKVRATRHEGHQELGTNMLVQGGLGDPIQGRRGKGKGNSRDVNGRKE